MNAHPQTQNIVVAQRNLAFVKEREEEGVGMGKSHWDRCQSRILTELGSAGASIWLAGAFCTAGIAGSVIVALMALPTDTRTLGAGVRGQLVVALIASLVLTAVLAAAHFTLGKKRKQLARDIVEEMNSHAIREAPRR